jgi:uncharacterized membrane protein
LLPVLGVFDLCSTLYVHLLGYPLDKYEAGLLPAFFAKAGFFYLYIPIYFAILFVVSFGLYHISNDLKPSVLLDKLIVLLIAGTVCFIYARLTGVILSNFLFNANFISRTSVMWSGYITATLVVLAFVYKELLKFLTFSGEEKV